MPSRFYGTPFTLWSLLSLGAGLLMLSPSTARAQPAAESQVLARSLGIEGIRLADEGHCRAALGKLEQAEQLHPAPTLLGRLGECQMELGQWALGLQSLTQVTQEPSTADTPQAFRLAKFRAQRLLVKFKANLAWLFVDLEGPRPRELKITVDEQERFDTSVAQGFPIAPGLHDLAVGDARQWRGRKRVDLAPGARLRVTVRLSLAPRRMDRASRRPPETVFPALAQASLNVRGRPVGRVVAAGRPQRPSSFYWGEVLIGLGIGGLAAGAFFGGMALRTQGELQHQCPQGSCPSGAVERIHALKESAALSSISFAAGVVTLGTGMALLFLGQPSLPPPETQARVQLWTSPWGGGVRGLF